jgi:hypothetical protein
VGEYTAPIKHSEGTDMRYVYKLDILVVGFIRALRDGVKPNLPKLSTNSDKDRAVLAWYEHTDKVFVGYDIGPVISTTVLIMKLVGFITEVEAETVLTELRMKGIIPAWEKRYISKRVAGIAAKLDEWFVECNRDDLDVCVPKEVAELLLNAIVLTSTTNNSTVN